MYICLGIVLTPEAVICAVNAHVEAINCYDDSENLCPFESHSRGDTPLMHLLDCMFFSRGHAETLSIFYPTPAIFHTFVALLGRVIISQ